MLPIGLEELSLLLMALSTNCLQTMAKILSMVYINLPHSIHLFLFLSYETETITVSKTELLGGPKGFADVIWTMESYKNDSHLTLSYQSFDGEEGNNLIRLNY